MSEQARLTESGHRRPMDDLYKQVAEITAAIRRASETVGAVAPRLPREVEQILNSAQDSMHGLLATWDNERRRWS